MYICAFVGMLVCTYVHLLVCTYVNMLFLGLFSRPKFWPTLSVFSRLIGDISTYIV